MAVSNATTHSWLKKTLALVNIRASGGSTRNTDAYYTESNGPQLGQSWKLVTGLPLPEYMDTASGALLEICWVGY